MIFVFGSNQAGRHGRGAALTAVKQHGAIYGQGFGRQGNSYAIPTKDYKLKPLPLSMIEWYISRFLGYARNNPDLEFFLTPIGTGLAGFTPADIAPMFKDSPKNINLPICFREELRRIALSNT